MDFYKQIFADIGYEPKTTFWQDFGIAERFGIKAINDTFNRAFDEWKTDVKYITELCLVLNWKIWYWHDNGKEDFAKLYNELWQVVDQWCMNNMKGDDLSYFLRITD